MACKTYSEGNQLCCGDPNKFCSNSRSVKHSGQKCCVHSEQALGKVQVVKSITLEQQFLQDEANPHISDDSIHG